MIRFLVLLYGVLTLFACYYIWKIHVQLRAGTISIFRIGIIGSLGAGALLLACYLILPEAHAHYDSFYATYLILLTLLCILCLILRRYACLVLLAVNAAAYVWLSYRQLEKGFSWFSSEWYDLSFFFLVYLGFPLVTVLFLAAAALVNTIST